MRGAQSSPLQWLKLRHFFKHGFSKVLASVLKLRQIRVQCLVGSRGGPRFIDVCTGYSKHRLEDAEVIPIIDDGNSWSILVTKRTVFSQVQLRYPELIIGVINIDRKLNRHFYICALIPYPTKEIIAELFYTNYATRVQIITVLRDEH